MSAEMSGSRRPHSQLTGWSVDAVEHIRTVHFSLIAICIALLVLVSSSDHTDVAEAREQLQMISEALRPWDNYFLTRAAGKWAAEYTSTHNERLPIRAFEPPDHDAKVIFISDPRTGKSAYRTIEFPKSNWMVDGPIRDYIPRLDKGAAFSSSVAPLFLDQPELFVPEPVTLTTFHKLWDALGSENKIIIPTDIAHTMYTFTLPADGEVNPGTIDSLFEQMSIRYEGSSAKAPSLKCTMLLARVSSDSDPALRIIAAGLAKPTPYMFVCLELSSMGRVSFIPVSKFREINFDAQGPLLEKVRAQQIEQKKGLLIPHGTFIHSFRSLNRVTNNYQDLNLSSFDPIFESELQRTGESFEAFGIKFPADQTIRWGILIVLALQLYLWIILREHAAKVKPDNAARDVAWIGLYESTVAKIVCFFTIAVLPGWVVGVLGFRAPHLGLATISTLLVAAAVFLSLTTALVSWKYLPNRKSR